MEYLLKWKRPVLMWEWERVKRRWKEHRTKVREVLL